MESVEFKATTTPIKNAEIAESPPFIPEYALSKKMKKVNLDFCVEPLFFLNNCTVKAGILCKVLDLDQLLEEIKLGDSGIKMIKAGANFVFTQDLALKLLKKGIVERASL